MPRRVPKSQKKRTEHPQETEFDTRLAGSTSRLKSKYLNEVEEHLEAKKILEDEQLKVRLLVTCLRGLRYELLNTDAARFGGLVKIIEKVIADVGWTP